MRRIRGAVALAAACLIVTPAGARTLEVGTDKAFATPSAAIAAAADGDHILIAPGEYFDCAVVHTSNVVIEGSGESGATTLTDKPCQGKALLVITGNDVTVRNLTLTRARVPDGNGAGIRAEGKNLVVEKVRFINNQDGLLAGDNAGSTITVRDSEFIRNGICEANCAHGIYVGGILLLHIQNSKFFETKQGHHIKSRALRTEIIGCDIQDGVQGTSSYLVDIPNGGSIVVRSSTLEKGPLSQNHTAAIMIGAEGVKNPTQEITVENNTFRNDGGYDTYFLDNITATEAHLVGNKISGRALSLKGDGDVDGRPPARRMGFKGIIRSMLGWDIALASGASFLVGAVATALVFRVVGVSRRGS